MNVTRSHTVGGDPLGSSPTVDIEDQLRDLRIDGYDVSFVRRVALLPAEIVERSEDAGA